jgi:hypothetical protein
MKKKPNKHGASRYRNKHKCRCDVCRKDHAKRQREWQQWKREER